MYIAQDKALFLLEQIDNFLISPQKHWLWVLIWSASPMPFKWVPTTYIFVDK